MLVVVAPRWVEEPLIASHSYAPLMACQAGFPYTP